MNVPLLDRRRFLTLAAACTLAGAASRGHASPVRAGAPTEVGPLAWAPLAPAHAVLAMDGRIHVAFELLVTNVTRYDVSLATVEVRDDATDRPTGTPRVASADGEDVTGRVRGFWVAPTQDAVDYATRLGPAQAGPMYFDLTYPTLDAVPKRLAIRIVSTVALPGGRAPVTFDVIGAPLDVVRAEPLVIAPPLAGGRWLVGNGAGPIITPHRYTLQAVRGTPRMPERYAIDFIRLDAQGLAFSGDPADVRRWPYYGTEVYAVAPGRVDAVRDGMPDQIPLQGTPPARADDYAGNHVIVAMDGGRYALYAHLMPGSVAVTRGERVRPGQKLGRLGNSGNTDAPHLHFQVMDAPSALDTSGLPFVFARAGYRGHLIGTLDGIGDTVFSGKPPAIDASGEGERRRRMPLTLDLVDFGNG